MSSATTGGSAERLGDGQRVRLKTALAHVGQLDQCAARARFRRRLELVGDIRGNALQFGSDVEQGDPGLDRQLYRPQDYDRFAGRLARVTMEDPETGKKKTVVARLEGLRRPEGADAEVATSAEVVLLDDKSGERQAIPLKNVKLARLEIEL